MPELEILSLSLFSHGTVSTENFIYKESQFSENFLSLRLRRKHKYDPRFTNDMGDKYDSLKQNVFQGFQRVKQDIEALNVRILLLESENRRLREELQRIDTKDKDRKPSEEDQKMSASQPSLNLETLRLFIKETVEETVREALRKENTKAADVFSTETEPETEQQPPEPPAQQEPPQPKTAAQRKQDRLKEDLMKNYERNRKDIVKQQILTEAAKSNLTRIQLRDIVVDQKKYCSKASFYRYTEELELEGLLQQKRKNNKTVLEPLTLKANH